MSTDRPRCCESWGLFYSPDRKVCGRHATPEEHALRSELDERAPAIGIKSDADGLLWPYGQNIDVETRARMLAWAEAHQLRLGNPGHRCLRWLRKGRCGGIVRGDLCREVEGYRWMDHVTCWIRARKPAVLVSQPYGLGDISRSQLAELDADPALQVEISTDAWYGHGTTFVGVWRAEAFWDLTDAAEVIAEAGEDAEDELEPYRKDADQ